MLNHFLNYTSDYEFELYKFEQYNEKRNIKLNLPQIMTHK